MHDVGKVEGRVNAVSTDTTEGQVDVGLPFEPMWPLAGICSLIFSFNKNSATPSYPTVTVQRDRELDLASG